ISYLKTVGGTNVKMTLRNLINAIIHPTALRSVNWSGRTKSSTGQEEKVGFKGLENIIIVLHAVVRSKERNSTRQEIKECLVDLLNHSNDVGRKR
ncbi:unnamed protein product, partial [Cyprideis torosa]